MASSLGRRVEHPSRSLIQSYVLEGLVGEASAPHADNLRA